MATWRPPKTSYWVTPPVKAGGGSDFQRIEENTEYLKELVDPIKFVSPSSNILLSATAERSVTGSDFQIVKRFRVHYKGVYRVTFEARTSSTSNGKTVGVRVLTTVHERVIARASTSYGSASVDIVAVPGDTIIVYLRGDYWHPPYSGSDETSTGYIRNVHVRGTVQTMAAIPGAAVLQN